tara:strand:+ start:390 stop:521 length:132 start_codon:yes stop_codon:yes gene_type:complete
MTTVLTWGFLSALTNEQLAVLKRQVEVEELYRAESGLLDGEEE